MTISTTIILITNNSLVVKPKVYVLGTRFSYQEHKPNLVWTYWRLQSHYSSSSRRSFTKSKYLWGFISWITCTLHSDKEVFLLYETQYEKG